MRLVLDTNVLIAAFVTRGHCHELFEHVARVHELFTSEFILEEFRDKLRGKLRVPEPDVAEALALQRSRMTSVAPSPLAQPTSSDPDDDRVLATAFAARADCLITGDSDLLGLGEHRGLAIVRPAAFWELESRWQDAGGSRGREGD